MHIYVCIFISMYVYTYMCIYTCIYLYIHMCNMCIYIYILNWAQKAAPPSILRAAKLLPAPRLEACVRDEHATSTLHGHDRCQQDTAWEEPQPLSFKRVSWAGSSSTTINSVMSGQEGSTSLALNSPLHKRGTRPTCKVGSKVRNVTGSKPDKCLTHTVKTEHALMLILQPIKKNVSLINTHTHKLLYEHKKQSFPSETFLLYRNKLFIQ